MAISLDILFAIILLGGIIAYSGLGIKTEPQSQILKITYPTQAKAILDDAIISLDNNGDLGRYLTDTSETINSYIMGVIGNRLKSVLPENLDFRLKISQYAQETDLALCRTTKKFEDCFKNPINNWSEDPITAYWCSSTGLTCPESSVPADREIYYGMQTFLKRQPYIKGLPENTCSKPSIQVKEETETKKSALSLQGEEINIVTRTIVKDNGGNDFDNTTNKMQCYDPDDDGDGTAGEPGEISDNEIATIEISEKSGERGPVSVMLLMDKSGSMNQYDISYGTLTGASKNNGTCGGAICTSDSTNCSNFTGWQQLGQITIDTALLNRLPFNESSLQIWSWITGAGVSSVCGKVPRIKIVSPAGTSYPGIDGTDGTISVSKTNLSASSGDWKIYGWSNVPLSNINIDTQLVYGRYKEIGTGLMNGSGTATGSGSECSNYDNYQKIGAFDTMQPFGGLPETQIKSVYGRFEYVGYAGKCDHTAVKVKDPNGNWFPANTTTCNKPNHDSFGGWCSNAQTISLQGTYEVWAWSDYVMNYTSKYYFYMYVGVPYPLSGLSISAGKCNDIDCSGTQSNCSASPTDWQTLGTINIPADEDLLGIKAQSSYAGYAGVCSTAIMRLKTPRVPDTYYNFNGSGKPNATNLNYSCYASLTQGQCGTIQNMAWPKLQTGNWDIEVWADESTDFGAVNLFIQRIDSAKKAAKSFLDNTAWKAQDQFGLVSYSNTAGIEQNLTTDEGLVKTAINNLHPGGETAIGYGIEQSTSALASSINPAKFIVVLTDGKANIPGLTEWQAAQYALSAATSARSQGVTIYAIGFANAAEIQSTVQGSSPARTYESVLQEIAKDKDTTYCTNPTNPGETANKYCGKYYFAATSAGLIELYELIAKEIGTPIPNTKIVVPKVSGMETCKCTAPNCAGECDPKTGTWTTSDLTYPGVDLGSNYKSQYYKARFPCNGVYCEKNFVEFPTYGSYESQATTTYIQKDGEYIYWGSLNTTCSPDCTGCTTHCTRQIDFDYRDLALTIDSGTISSTSKSQLNFSITNTGKLSYKPENLQIAFYKDTIEEANRKSALPLITCSISSCGPIPVETITNILWTASSALGPGGIGSFSSGVATTGFIKAVMSGAKECQLNNDDLIACLQKANVYYFKVEYWAWVK